MTTISKKLVAVTPAKNEEKFIEKCIRSVLNQTYPVTLHLIVDDNSDDRTREIAESFCSHRVAVISSGLGKGIKVHGLRPHLVQEIGVREITRRVSDWKYCLLLDADTWIPPHYCERLIMEMERNPGLVMAGARFLKTPKGVEASPETHVRSSNHIIKREFYNRCAIGYGTFHGEILLERIAWILGFEVKSFPLMAFSGRPTGVTVENPLLKGVHDYKLGTPILSLLLSLRKPDRKKILRVFGWMYGKLSRERRYFPRKCVHLLYRRYFSYVYRRIKEKLPW